MADDEAVLAQISDVVGAPERNISAVVRKRGETDEQKALRKAGYSPLQRAALLSPLANALARSDGMAIREQKLELERERVSQADARLAQGYDRLGLQQELVDMRSEREGVKLALDQFKLEQERARNQTATAELTQAANFFRQGSQLNPEDPDFMNKLMEIEPVVSAETDTGKAVAGFLKDRISKHEIAGQKLIPSLTRAAAEGYSGIVTREDGSIDPWASYKGLPEWAKTREQEKISREDSKTATGREFTAAQSDIAALKKQRSELEKQLSETVSDKQGPIQSQLEDIEEAIGDAIKARKAAINPASKDNSTNPELSETPPKNTPESAVDALRKLRESKK